MQIKKHFILILIACLSSLCPTGYALEDSFALMFVLAAGKSPMARQSCIEVTSTEAVYIKETNVLPLSDTQCLYTETPAGQVCFGNNRPTRIRLLPVAPLTMGFHPLGLSLVEYTFLPTAVTDPLFPGQDAIPEFYPVAKAIAAKLQQDARRQREITEAAEQWRMTLSLISDHNSFDWLKEDIEEDSEITEGWRLYDQEPGMDDRNRVQARFDGGIPIEPGIRYCFFSDTDSQGQNDCQALVGSNGGSNDDSKKDSGNNSDSSQGESDDSKSKESEKESGANPEVARAGKSEAQIAPDVYVYYRNMVEGEFETEPPSGASLFSYVPGPDQPGIVETDNSPKINKPSPSGKKPSDLPGNCPICGRQIAQRKNIKAHMRTHTRTHTRIPIRIRIRTGEKPYPCAVCSNEYATSYGLQVHMRTHTGEKPYRCGHCDRGFTSSSSLTIHVRTHTGEKPYQCRICNKRFSVSGNLNKHMRTHTGEKPYQCGICNKSFPLGSDLIKHEQAHPGPECKRQRLEEQDDGIDEQE